MQATAATQPQQIERIADLAAKIWRAHYVPLIGSEQVEYMLSAVQSVAAISASITDGCQYFLLSDDNQDIGYCAFEQRPDHCFLSKIYVDATCRGRGYGAQTLQFVEDAAVVADQQRLRLTVNKDNGASIAWYQRRGFEIIEEICIDIGQGYVMDDYLLEKQL